MYAGALGLWVFFLVGAAFYTRRAGHKDASPLASYLIFITVLTVTAFSCFIGLALLLQASGAIAALQHPFGIVVFLILVFVPAALLARWQMRQPPKRVRPS